MGQVFSAQTTFKVEGIPPKRYPDLAFVAAERLPANFRIEADFAPDLAVEVVSKNDTDFEIEEKIIRYQQSNVKLIWIVHPVNQTVEVYRLVAGLKAQTFIKEEELDGENVIPGFRLKVSRLFDFYRSTPKTAP